jgi:hypothetical protein
MEEKNGSGCLSATGGGDQAALVVLSSKAAERSPSMEAISRHKVVLQVPASAAAAKAAAERLPFMEAKSRHKAVFQVPVSAAAGRQAAVLSASPGALCRRPRMGTTLLLSVTELIMMERKLRLPLQGEL